MSMSENKAIEYKISGLIDTQPVSSGDVHIFKSALLNFDVNGYIVKASDSSTDRAFAGFSLQELDQKTGGAIGDNKVKFMRAGSGAIIEDVTINTSVTQANIGATVYVDGDDSVDLTGGVSNHVVVGKIFNVKSATLVDVQI